MLDTAVVTTAIYLLVIGFVAVGVAVFLGRWLMGTKDPTSSFVRSWIGLSLVLGLLVACAVSFSVDDVALRNALFGGLIANVGAATAFYFASANSDQARQDILTASGVRVAVLVPDVAGKSVTEAESALAALPLGLKRSPDDATGTAKVDRTVPAAGMVARAGDTLTAFTSPGP